MKESMNLKKYSILADENHEKILWSDLRGGVSGTVVGLARNVQASIEQAYSTFQEEKARKQKEAQEAARRQTPAQDQSQTQAPSAKPSRREESQGESQSKGIKFGRH